MDGVAQNPLTIVWAVALGVIPVLLIMTVLLGPQVARLDLRMDLANADILKTYPLRGWQIVLGEVLTPVAILSVVFWLELLLVFLTMPGDLEEAARIDGANAWQIFTRIVLPLSQPVLAALAIFAFRSAWNDFLWPLIAVNKPEMFPLPVALALLRSAYSAESYGPIMAGATLSALPLLVVFLLANRRIIEGVRVGGLKS